MKLKEEFLVLSNGHLPLNYSNYLEQFYNPPSQEHSLLQVGKILQLAVDLGENFS